MSRDGADVESWTDLRITVVGPSYPLRGGIAHYTALLSSALATGHEVRVVSLSRQYPSLLFPGKAQTDHSLSAIKVEGAEPLIDSINPLSWLRASRHIRNWRPDLVIFQWWHPFFAPAFGTIAGRCRKFSRVMFICHNVLPHERTGPVKTLTRFALSRGDLFITHSDQDLANLRALVPVAGARKVRHPTYAVFDQQPVTRAQARQQLGLGQTENVILFFGLVRKYKGLKYLIQAMPAILASVDATLLVVGEFYDDRDEYVRLIKDLDVGRRVRLKDEYVPNEKVGLYFTAADLVVLPYVSATQSGIVQIAYAFDRPVVTTSVGGLPEAVKDGETGYLVPPEDPESLAGAVVRFFREERALGFSRSAAAFREEFSWDRLVEAIESLAAQGGPEPW